MADAGEAYGFEASDIDRIAALLQAFESGRLQMTGLTPPAIFGPPPIPTRVALTTTDISGMVGTAPGTGMVQLQKLVAGSGSGAATLDDQGDDDILVYNPNASSINNNTYVLLVREPISGEYFTVCPCPAFLECSCDNVDVVFLFDTTGSMGAHIDVVRETFRIIASRLGTSTTCKFGVAEFRDYDFGCSPFLNQLDLAITNDQAAVDAAIAALNTGCGDDIPEDHLDAIEYLCNNWTGAVGGSSDLSRKRIIFVVSDAPAHVLGDPRDDYGTPPNYPDPAAVLTLLKNNCIAIVGFNYGTMGGTAGTLATTPVIPHLATATHGDFFNVEDMTPETLANVVCTALGFVPSCGDSSGSGTGTGTGSGGCTASTPCCFAGMPCVVCAIVTGTGDCSGMAGTYTLVWDGASQWTTGTTTINGHANSSFSLSCHAPLMGTAQWLLRTTCNFHLVDALATASCSFPISFLGLSNSSCCSGNFSVTITDCSGSGTGSGGSGSGGSGSGSGSGMPPITTTCCPSGLPATLHVTVSNATGDCACFDGSYACIYNAPGNPGLWTTTLSICDEPANLIFEIACIDPPGVMRIGVAGASGAITWNGCSLPQTFTGVSIGGTSGGNPCTGTVDITITS